MKKWLKKRGKGKITFLLIPANSGTSKRFNLAPSALVAMLTALGSIIILAGIVTCLYVDNWIAFHNVDAIQEESRNKDVLIKTLDGEIQLIENEQRLIDNKQQELQKMMGIQVETKSEAEVSAGGQGGADQVMAEGDLGGLIRAQQIKTRLYSQERQLDELLARVENNLEYFRCIPNNWPAEGELSSDFGWRKSPFGRKNETYHNGIDIANNGGTAVMAAGDGIVTKAGWDGVYGRAITIDHGYGLSTMYGHNARLMVKTGDKVEKGQTIAEMGSTGRSTGTHLHFTVMRYGVELDPMIYLPNW